MTFIIPTTPTSVFGSEIVDNRGTWSVESVGSSGELRASASLSVSDPALNVADLSISTIVTGGDNLAAGDNITFTLFVVSYGPDAAANVEITDQVPTNTTFISESHSDPAFTCTNPNLGATGTTTCMIASLAKGVRASITLTYKVNAGSPVNTTILNRAEISSTTAQRSTRDKISEAGAVVTAAAGGWFWVHDHVSQRHHGEQRTWSGWS